jgi:uridine phosphorylase
MKKNTIVNNSPIAPSELIISPEGRIYHLDLLPTDISDNIIVVGDQERVERVSSYFDTIEVKISKREFVTHTGTIRGKRITVLSTGIGCDNIDIVINELDALVNIDFKTRLPNKEHRVLNIIRLGTSGSLQEDIPVDSFVISTFGLGFDGLLSFYDAKYDDIEEELKKEFIAQIEWGNDINTPYFVQGDDMLIKAIGKGMYSGITATANGFYGPQGRVLRLPAKIPTLNEQLFNFKYKDFRITNFEMETSALYGLCAMLGHRACTVCAIIANRFKKEYSKDYKKTVDVLIQDVLSRFPL